MLNLNVLMRIRMRFFKNKVSYHSEMLTGKQFRTQLHLKSETLFKFVFRKKIMSVCF